MEVLVDDWSFRKRICLVMRKDTMTDPINCWWVAIPVTSIHRLALLRPIGSPPTHSTCRLIGSPGSTWLNSSMPMAFRRIHHSMYGGTGVPTMSLSRQTLRMQHTTNGEDIVFITLATWRQMSHPEL